MKQFIAYIFANLFKIFQLFPVDTHRITFIMTHDHKFNGKLKAIYEELCRDYPMYQVNIISRNDYDNSQLKSIRGILKGIGVSIRLLLLKNYYLATSKYVFLNNIFITGAYLTFKKEVEVVQFWHAMGTFKQFGEDYSPGSRIDTLQRKANQIYTKVIVHAPQDIKIYAQAFGISEDKVDVTEDPSCRLFFAPTQMKQVREKLEHQYPDIIGRKIILYAPTYRTKEEDNERVIQSIQQMVQSLDKEVALLVRLHPHIAKSYVIPIASTVDCVYYDVSYYDEVNELLSITDLLITDYSSIFYPFLLMEKPIVFYAFDLEEYKRTRGFYYAYESFVPGEVIADIKDLKAVEDYDTQKVRAFKENYFKNYERLNGKVLEDLLTPTCHVEI